MSSGHEAQPSITPYFPKRVVDINDPVQIAECLRDDGKHDDYRHIVNSKYGDELDLLTANEIIADRQALLTERQATTPRTTAEAMQYIGSRALRLSVA